jgi:hypothetical protein
MGQLQDKRLLSQYFHLTSSVFCSSGCGVVLGNRACGSISLCLESVEGDALFGEELNDGFRASFAE